MKKTKKKTTKKNARTVRVSIGALPSERDFGAAPRRSRAELERELRICETERLGAKTDAAVKQQEIQKLQARLFLLGAANMYLADRLVKAAAMIESRLAGIIDGGKTARALDDVILFCKGMI